MSGISVIRDMLWLVLQSEDACPVVDGVEIHQHVRVSDISVYVGSDMPIVSEGKVIQYGMITRAYYMTNTGHKFTPAWRISGKLRKLRGKSGVKIVKTTFAQLYTPCYLVCKRGIYHLCPIFTS